MIKTVTVTFSGSSATQTATWSGVGAQHSIQVGVSPSDGFGPIRPWLTNHFSTQADVNVPASWSGTVMLVVYDSPQGPVWPAAPTTQRISGPIPDATATFGGSSAVIAYALPIPSDAASFYLRLSNRTGIANGTGVSITSNVAVYQSDGTGLPTGSALGSWTSQTVPGNGTELVLGPITPTRGTDGNVVVCYSFPASTTYADARFQTWGAYVIGTTTVNPSPGGWTPGFTDGVLWVVAEYSTSKRRIVVLGDSISVGAAPPGATPPGFLAAAWNKVATDKGYAVSIFGMSGSTLAEWADNVTYPALWADQIFTGASVHIELGVNDLATRTALQMETDITTIVTRVKASGAVKVYANTIAPNAANLVNDAQRIAYNSWLRANSLGLDGVVDLAAKQNVGGMADNTTTTVLYAGFDAGDGTHFNAAGNVQVAAAVEAIIG